MSGLLSVGYSLRVSATTPVEGWSDERKRSRLLDPDVRRPLSACDSLWPYLDERLAEQHYDRHHASGDLAPIGWLSLSDLLDAAKRLGVDPRVGTTIAIASRVLFRTLLSPAVPPAVGPDWKEMGWDVVGGSGHGALCDFGFSIGAPSRKVLAGWRSSLNAWHLFGDEAVALEFAAWRSRTMADHGPFFALSLFEIPV